MSNEALANGLIAHWPFRQDCEDRAGYGLTVRNHGVKLSAEGPAGRSGAAVFNGQDAYLEVEHHPALNLGTSDFSIAGWVYTEPTRSDVVGNIVSKFDPQTRQGMQLYILSSTGVTSTAQPNYRNLHFGIDHARFDLAWTDCGRPGNAVQIMALMVAGGALYASTLEIGAQEMGHLWRYEGNGQWLDLGNPQGCNAISSIVEFDGQIYCGLGRYIGQGSDLGDLPNRIPGGQVYRLEADGRWVFCGHPGAEDATPEDDRLPDFSQHVHAKSSEGVATSAFSTGKADDVIGLTVYRGNLYCTSHHRRGAFVYEGGQNWKYIGPDERILSFTVHHDHLYALINGGPVYRYEGDGAWTHCGRPEKAIQSYSAVTSGGQLYIGTWPEAEVYRYEGEKTWTPVTKEGRVGYERELMATALYNGKVYIGSLPMANVWRMDGRDFTFVGNLDATAASLRRVWSMAIYQGRLFAGTLPSGRVYSIEAGKLATWDHVFPSGWHHLAATRHHDVLQLYVDGQLVASTAGVHPTGYNLDNEQPLQIGFGAYDYFNGSMSDLRLYRRPLTIGEIAELATV